MEVIVVELVEVVPLVTIPVVLLPRLVVRVFLSIVEVLGVVQDFLQVQTYLLWVFIFIQ